MKVGILGAGGRMGRELIRAVGASDDLDLAAAVDRPDGPFVGIDSGLLIGAPENNIKVSSSLENVIDDLDVLIDFSLPVVTVAASRLCAQRNVKMVIGTTGFTAEQQAALEAAAEKIAIVKATNMSIGVNLTFKLAYIAAKAFGDSVDIEVVEAHHRNKIDAPSGTALSLGESVADALGRDLNTVALYGRQGQMGIRDRDTIGFSTIRGGDIVGDHTVMFIGDGERVEITHRSNSRENYAVGATRACTWLHGKLCGLFDMQDVLDLRDSGG